MFFLSFFWWLDERLVILYIDCLSFLTQFSSFSHSYKNRDIGAARRSPIIGLYAP